jgi:hypothetical protein
MLLGYYKLPEDAQGSVEAVVCPPAEERSAKKVWNYGDRRLKFIVLENSGRPRS